jgi:hypothetical protein
LYNLISSVWVVSHNTLLMKDFSFGHFGKFNSIDET